MRGYVGVTDSGWYRFNKLSNNKEIVFWRKSSTPVGIQPGEYFFLLVRGHLPRSIKGYGVVGHVDIKSPIELWENYGKKNGCNSLNELEFILHKTNNAKVAYYYLTDVVYFDNEKIITDEEIGFAKDIMAGKFISGEKLSQIVDYYKNGKKPNFEKISKSENNSEVAEIEIKRYRKIKNKKSYVCFKH